MLPFEHVGPEYNRLLEYIHARINDDPGFGSLSSDELSRLVGLQPLSKSISFEEKAPSWTDKCLRNTILILMLRNGSLRRRVGSYATSRSDVASLTGWAGHKLVRADDVAEYIGTVYARNQESIALIPAEEEFSAWRDPRPRLSHGLHDSYETTFKYRNDAAPQTSSHVADSEASSPEATALSAIRKSLEALEAAALEIGGIDLKQLQVPGTSDDEVMKQVISKAVTSVQSVQDTIAPVIDLVASPAAGDGTIPAALQMACLLTGQKMPARHADPSYHNSRKGSVPGDDDAPTSGSGSDMSSSSSAADVAAARERLDEMRLVLLHAALLTGVLKHSNVHFSSGYKVPPAAPSADAAATQSPSKATWDRATTAMQRIHAIFLLINLGRHMPLEELGIHGGDSQPKRDARSDEHESKAMSGRHRWLDVARLGVVDAGGGGGGGGDGYSDDDEYLEEDSRRDRMMILRVECMARSVAALQSASQTCVPLAEVAPPDLAAAGKRCLDAFQHRSQLMDKTLGQSEGMDTDWAIEQILNRGQRQIQAESTMKEGRSIMKSLDQHKLSQRMGWIASMRTGMFGTRLEGTDATVTSCTSSSATGGLAGAATGSGAATPESTGADQLEVPMFRGFGVQNRMELSVLSALLGRSRQRHDPSYIGVVFARCMSTMRPLICRVKAELETLPLSVKIQAAQASRQKHVDRDEKFRFRSAASDVAASKECRDFLPLASRAALMRVICELLQLWSPSQVHAAAHSIVALLPMLDASLSSVRLSRDGQLLADLKPVRKDGCFGLVPHGDPATSLLVAIDAWYEAAQALSAFLPSGASSVEADSLATSSSSIDEVVSMRIGSSPAYLGSTWLAGLLTVCLTGRIVRSSLSIGGECVDAYPGESAGSARAFHRLSGSSDEVQTIHSLLDPMKGVESLGKELEQMHAGQAIAATGGSRHNGLAWSQLMALFVASYSIFNPFPRDNDRDETMMRDLAMRAFVPAAVRASRTLLGVHHGDLQGDRLSAAPQVAALMMEAAACRLRALRASTAHQLAFSDPLPPETTGDGLDLAQSAAFFGNVMLRLRNDAERSASFQVYTDRDAIGVTTKISGASVAKYLRGQVVAQLEPLGANAWLNPRDHIHPLAGIRRFVQGPDASGTGSDGTTAAASSAETKRASLEDGEDGGNAKCKGGDIVAYLGTPGSWLVITYTDADELVASAGEDLMSRLPPRDRWLVVELPTNDLFGVGPFMHELCGHFRDACASLPWSLHHSTTGRVIEGFLRGVTPGPPAKMPVRTGLEQFRTSVQVRDWPRARYALKQLAGRVPRQRLWLEMTRASEDPVLAVEMLATEPEAFVLDFYPRALDCLGKELQVELVAALNKAIARCSKAKYDGVVVRQATISGVSSFAGIGDAPEVRASFLAACQTGVTDTAAHLSLLGAFAMWKDCLLEDSIIRSMQPTRPKDLLGGILGSVRIDPAEGAGSHDVLPLMQKVPAPCPQLRSPEAPCRAAAPPMLMLGDRSASIKVGAAWNVFDGEELLEASIRSVMEVTHYRVAVYQRVSHFGRKCSATLLKTLKSLVDRGFLHEIVEYDYKKEPMTKERKKSMTSRKATGMDLGGARPEEIGDQFIHEVSKREQGRQLCLKAGCDLFMSMDCDECYEAQALRSVCETIVRLQYDGAVCLMRHYIRHPCWEMTPMDRYNYVSVVWRLSEHLPCRLGCPTGFLLDPTRRVEHATKILELRPDQMVMHHFTLVRNNIDSKLGNVSNRNNYLGHRVGRNGRKLDGALILRNFVKSFKDWNPRDHPLVHPHPSANDRFFGVVVTPNLFNIEIKSMKTCPDLEPGSVYLTIPDAGYGEPFLGCDGQRYVILCEMAGMMGPMGGPHDPMDPGQADLARIESLESRLERPHYASGHDSGGGKFLGDPARAHFSSLDDKSNGKAVGGGTTAAAAAGEPSLAAHAGPSGAGTRSHTRRDGASAMQSKGAGKYSGTCGHHSTGTLMVGTDGFPADRDRDGSGRAGHDDGQQQSAPDSGSATRSHAQSQGRTPDTSKASISSSTTSGSGSGSGATGASDGKVLADAIQRTEHLLNQFASQIATATGTTHTASVGLIGGHSASPDVGSQASARHLSAAEQLAHDDQGASGPVDEAEAKAALSRLASIGIQSPAGSPGRKDASHGGAGGTAADTYWAGGTRGGALAVGGRRSGSGGGGAGRKGAASGAGSSGLDGIDSDGLDHVLGHRVAGQGVVDGGGASSGAHQQLSGKDGDEARRLIQEGLAGMDDDGLGLD